MPFISHLRIYLVLSILCFSLYTGAAVESMHFDIFLFGSKIGTMTVTRERQPDGTERYISESKTKAKILWIDKENTSQYEATYRDGQLLSMNHKEVENGKVKRWTTITWDGKKYAVDSYKGKSTLTEPPANSIGLIYFHDYSHVTRIFYDAEADFDNVEHPDASTIEFKSSDGIRNTYYLENGHVKGMDFHLSIATVKMVRVN